MIGFTRRTIPALLVMLLAIGCSAVSKTPVGPPSATPGALSTNLHDLGWIAFTSQRDGNPEIYVMRPDGSEARRLTNGPADDVQPAWSPDGKRIAFASKREGNYEIYLMDANGGSVSRLTNDQADDMQPSWSPDGRQIAFASKRGGVFGIYVMNSDGTNVKNLPTGQDLAYNPAWSPDGKLIAFWSTGLFLMTADGRNLRQIAETAFPSNPAAWSPDGKQIAYVAVYQGGAPEIDVITASGSGRTQFRLSASGPAFSPDGTYIAYSSSGRLFVARPDSKTGLQISDDGREPSWTR